MEWVLLGGDRLAVTAILVAIVFLVTLGLVGSGVIVVGPSGSLPAMLGSGGLSGLLTLLTVALSINHLTLSRLFGSPGALADRLEGTIEFRRTVEDLAGEDGIPNDPGEFLALVAGMLGDEVERLADSIPRGAERSGEFAEFTDALGEYADELADVQDTDSTVDVLATILGPAYADNLTVAHGLQRGAEGDRPEATEEHLDAVVTLLETIAVARQFLKTIVVHQDLARLSRRLIYTGFLAVLSVVYLTLAYTSSAVTIPSVHLPWIAAAVITLLVAPLAEIVSTLLRIATVAMYSVSVGPFVPPEERTS